MHTIPELVRQAGAVGLVTQREVLAGRVSVRCESADDSVHAILVGDEPVGYVKKGTDGTGTDDIIGRERRALSCLSAEDLGPQLLPGQPGNCLWVGVVRGVGLARIRGSAPELAEVCETWGVAVAQLHRLSTGRTGVPEAPRPWLLLPGRRDRAAHQVARGSARAGVLDAIDSESGLAAVTSEVAARWTDRHWMHGELTAAHVVVEIAPPVRVRFLNFENAGAGDPAWDLATAMDTITWMSQHWQTPAAPLIDYFLRGYRRAGGMGTVYPAMSAVRSLATAWWLAGFTDSSSAEVGGDTPEVGGGPAEVGGSAHWWLERARSFAARAGSRAHRAA